MNTVTERRPMVAVVHSLWMTLGVVTPLLYLQLAPG